MAATTKKSVVTVNFALEKPTKNTIRFGEVLPSELAAPIIGTLYIPKSTLGQIGWSEGKELVVTVSTK